ncbi:MAG: Xaa-Pro peptidase family protein [Aromatoleum sp.]|jgi:Xaa-Pro aminopeptidase|uniref:M24 family metallopeptidase n=1 Tax=Aromatoleum sp. TaxID=2307007 RepID=UPI002895F916|nr:Xaa-Pro peptidase family protein [Aromatoleum sp.]MDT3669899.1 Xaa-Pro peptidase family protein [Aromatoleum sp.]
MTVRLAPKLTFGGGGLDWSEGINFARMREERHAKARASLKKHGIAACLVFRPENIRYATGARGLEFIDQTRYTLLAEGHAPILYEPHRSVHGIHPWIDPDNIRQAYHWANGAPGPAATQATAKRFAAQIKSQLKEFGLEGEKLGIDRIDEPGRRALEEAGIHLVDVMPAMLEARAVKTKDEINCLRMATAIAEVGWCAIYDKLRIGVTDRELVAVANEAMYKAGAEEIWGVLVSSGGSGSGTTDKIVQPGDIVTVDFVRSTYMGYNTCYYRNAIVGQKPSQKVRDLHRREYERIYRALEAIKPGASTADVAVLWDTAEQKGAKSEQEVWCDDMAHGLGLWLYEYPVINRLWSLEHPQIFQPGMAMAIEALDPIDPTVGRVKLEEMIVVTEDGVEVMSKLPIEEIMVAHPLLTG